MTVGKEGFCDYSERKKIRCQGLSEISDWRIKDVLSGRRVADSFADAQLP
jgi:hypothetical protein